jgi:uncharacterized protein YsxB (DUF464 family)
VIRLSVRLRDDGCLAAFAASGHAGSGPRGRDLACAAASVLLRTTARLLAAQPELRVRGQAAVEGELALELSPPPPERREWVRGVTATLVAGLRDLEREFPGSLKLEVGVEEHGTQKRRRQRQEQP